MRPANPMFKPVVTSAADPPGRAGVRGFILVAVLWILAALAALVSIYAVYVSNAAVGSRVGDDRLQAEASIWAGSELTAYRLSGYGLADRPTSGRFEFRMSRANVVVDFRSEGARIDLNAASKDLLSGLFATLGASRANAAYFADRIVAWRKKTPDGDQSEETTAYRKAGLRYAPRQAPFQNVEELRLVLGLPPELVDRALPYLTIYNGRPEIDANEADRAVLAALPHISPDAVAEILRIRDPRNSRAVLSLLGEARAGVALESRNATRANIRVVLDRGRRISAEVVILVLEDGPEPYRVLSWRDDFDGPG